jgi:hypothetical protein
VHISLLLCFVFDQSQAPRDFEIFAEISSGGPSRGVGTSVARAFSASSLDLDFFAIMAQSKRASATAPARTVVAFHSALLNAWFAKAISALI